MNVLVGPHWIVTCDNVADRVYYQDRSEPSKTSCVHWHEKSKRPGTQLVPEPRPEEGEDE